VLAPNSAGRLCAEGAAVIKRVSLVRRKVGMGREEFLAHWMGPHAEIVRHLPGVRGLRFGVVTQWSPEEASWDGVGEVWFDSIEAANAAFASEPHHSLLVADRRSFLGEAQSCFVEEHTVLAPPKEVGGAG
jgi:uncharacterized protein (TIGR02118 family)